MPFRRILLFTASFFAFFWLALAIGGDRLLATEAPEQRTVAETRSLPLQCVAFGAQAEPYRQSAEAARQDARYGAAWVRERVAGRLQGASRTDAWPIRDANGNVLRQDRYMQAVYHAFSLEDTGG